MWKEPAKPLRVVHCRWVVQQNWDKSVFHLETERSTNGDGDIDAPGRACGGPRVAPSVLLSRRSFCTLNLDRLLFTRLLSPAESDRALWLAVISAPHLHQQDADLADVLDQFDWLTLACDAAKCHEGWIPVLR
jgi:hypothetical protein